MEEKQKHIPTGTLESYVTNELSDEEIMAIDEHLAVCLKCTEKLRTLRPLNFVFDQWTAKAHGEYFAGPIWQRSKEGFLRLRSEIIVKIDMGMAVLTSAILPGMNAFQFAPATISREEIPRPEGKLPTGQIQVLEVPDISGDFQMKLIFSVNSVGKPNLDIVFKEQKTQKGISSARITLYDGSDNLLEGGTTSETGIRAFSLDKGKRYYVAIVHQEKRWQIPFQIK